MHRRCTRLQRCCTAKGRPVIAHLSHTRGVPRHSAPYGGLWAALRPIASVLGGASSAAALPPDPSPLPDPTTRKTAIVRQPDIEAFLLLCSRSLRVGNRRQPVLLGRQGRPSRELTPRGQADRGQGHGGCPEVDSGRHRSSKDGAGGEAGHNECVTSGRALLRPLVRGRPSGAGQREHRRPCQARSSSR